MATGTRLFLALALCGGCGATTDAPTTSALNGVPPPAADALRREAAGATIERVEREREGGAEVYEGEWHRDGLEHSVTVTASGRVVEREDEVPAAQVPGPVRDVAVAALPKGQKVVFVRMMSGNYEAATMVDGKEHEVTVTAAGQLVPNDDDDHDGDDD